MSITSLLLTQNQSQSTNIIPNIPWCRQSETELTNTNCLMSSCCIVCQSKWQMAFIDTLWALWTKIIKWSWSTSFNLHNQFYLAILPTRCAVISIPKKLCGSFPYFYQSKKTVIHNFWCYYKHFENHQRILVQEGNYLAHRYRVWGLSPFIYYHLQRCPKERN